MLPNSDELSVEFPARRDDEPESLRADIIDELTDHLQCALNRELHTNTTDTESAARQRAIARFGSPTRVARRLWYDAMKERLMSQRLTMAAAIVMACACLAMFALMWRSIGNQQDFMATQQQHIDALTLQMRQDADEATRHREQLQALLAESQEMNRELAVTGAKAWATENTVEETHAIIDRLTERLNQMEERAATETSDWNPVELRLVQGAENGEPAVGFRVRMSITTDETGIPPAATESDQTGVVRFERVRYGVYDVLITAPWNEFCYHRISLQPGESYEATIVCPASAPEPLEAQLAVDWPEDLEDRPIFMRVNPWHTYRVVGDESWSITDDAVDRSRAFFRRSDSRLLFVSSTGVIHFEDRRGFSDDAQGVSDPLFVAAADGDSPVRVMHWPGADYAVRDVEFYVALSDGVQTSASGEVLREDTFLLPLNNASIDRNALQWRVEPGSPNRIVLIPPGEVVSAVRAFYEGQSPSIPPGRRPSFPGERNPTRLPAALMTTDLASADGATQ